MLEVDFSRFPVLSTARLMLRQIDVNDAEELLYLRSHPEIMRFIPRPLATGKEDVLALIAQFNCLADNNDAINWGIVSKTDNKLIGMIGLFRMKKEHFRTEIGYMLHDAWQRKGLMHEALQEVIGYCFRELGFHSLEALIDPENVASERLLQKCGFIKEGHFKESEYYNGKFLDTVVYSLLTTK